MEQQMKIADLSPEEQQKIRDYNRLHKQQSRDKRRSGDISKMMSEVDKERAATMNDNGRRERLASGQCFFGEVSPGIDARTIDDALQVCREFARALVQADIQPTESLYDFELRIGTIWAERGGPFLNRNRQTLSRGWGEGTFGQGYFLPFEEKYVPLPGAKKPVDVTSLSKLPDIPVVPTPTPVETPAEVTPSDNEIRSHGRVQLLHQLSLDPSIPDQARQYLEGPSWR
jgi:hypothetical protein